MNLINKLHDDFKLSPEDSLKFHVSSYEAQEWELYDVCVFSSLTNKKNRN